MIDTAGGWHRHEGVSHVTVAEAGDYVVDDLPEGMVVFWWNGRPVGHDFIGPSQSHVRFGRIPPDVLSRVRAEEAAASSPLHTASVVICTRDRPRELQRCLASLRQQTYQPREMIVVDNASRERTVREVARAAGATYVREDRAGLDIARNTGARHATSAIVAYTDDDVLLHRRWLERLVAAFNEPKVEAATGLVLPAELATEAQRHFEMYWGFGRGYVRHDFDAACFESFAGRGGFPAWDVGAGANMAFRRDLLERVGFFDERLDAGQAGCSGDSELWYRLIAGGSLCRYEPSAVAFHFHRRTMEGLSKQIFYYMRGHVAALLVQFERTGIVDNRARAFSILPRAYGRRLWNRLRGRKAPEDLFLREEVLGYLSGLLFYYRNRRTRH